MNYEKYHKEYMLRLIFLNLYNTLTKLKEERMVEEKEKFKIADKFKKFKFFSKCWAAWKIYLVIEKE